MSNEAEVSGATFTLPLKTKPDKCMRKNLRLDEGKGSVQDEKEVK